MTKNYENSKIYKIVCNVTGLIYVGSTTKKLLSKRLSGHVYDFKNPRNSKGISHSSKVLENGNFSIILLEDFPCKNKNELLARERHYIELLDCINITKPLRTSKEYANDHPEQVAESKLKYKLNNQDKIKKKINCECGGKYTAAGKSAHMKTQKHINFIQ